MTTYEAKVTKTLEMTFTFTDDDIAPEDTPFDAAAELSITYPETAWSEEDFDIQVDEVK